jgi:hypothetical protein
MGEGKRAIRERRLAKIFFAILKALAWFFGSMAVLFVGLYTWSTVTIASADRNARAFCASVKPGSDMDELVARVDSAGTPKRMTTGDREMMFMYSGGAFHVGACRVTFVGGKVESARVVIFDN